MNWFKVQLEATVTKNYGFTKEAYIKDHTFIFCADQNEEIMDKLKELVVEETEEYISECNNIKILSIKTVSKCLACRKEEEDGYIQPNQLAHMDPGGCLYMDN